MSKERPILFSGPMVKAILEGRKTQTRRVIKPQPAETTDKVVMAGDGSCEVKFFSTVANGIYLSSDNWRKCPYGQPGDLLWVRETAIIGPKNGNDKLLFTTHEDDDGDKRYVQYLASNPHADWAKAYGLKKTPSIFMPRWASRITLEVTAVRVERLQGISEEDAQKEGVSFSLRDSFMDSFFALWNEINGKTYPWESNPFVWVVEFKVQK